MATLYGAVNFNSLLLIFLVNTFDQVYVTALMISIADMLAFISSGIIVEKHGVKVAFLIPLTIATISGVLFLLYGLSH